MICIPGGEHSFRPARKTISRLSKASSNMGGQLRREKCASSAVTTQWNCAELLLSCIGRLTQQCLISLRVMASSSAKTVSFTTGCVPFLITQDLLRNCGLLPGSTFVTLQILAQKTQMSPEQIVIVHISVDSDAPGNGIEFHLARWWTSSRIRNGSKRTYPRLRFALCLGYFSATR